MVGNLQKIILKEHSSFLSTSASWARIKSEALGQDMVVFRLKSVRQLLGG